MPPVGRVYLLGCCFLPPSFCVVCFPSSFYTSSCWVVVLSLSLLWVVAFSTRLLLRGGVFALSSSLFASLKNLSTRGDARLRLRDGRGRSCGEIMMRQASSHAVQESSS